VILADIGSPISNMSQADWANLLLTIAGFVVGMAGILWVTGPIAAVLGIVGVVIGAFGLVVWGQNGFQGDGVSTTLLIAGFVVGMIALLPWMLMVPGVGLFITYALAVLGILLTCLGVFYWAKTTFPTTTTTTTTTTAEHDHHRAPLWRGCRLAQAGSDDARL
jgi:hypothetical protein